MLQFPTARLEVYDRLVKGGQCCVRALIGAARDYGIIQGDSLEHEKLPADLSCCGSQYAARKILELAMQQRGFNRDGTAHLSDEIWDSMVEAIEQFKRNTQLVHERDAGDIPAAIECSKMAPVVFDILLQKLTPYL
jgi:hypothetical protein